MRFATAIGRHRRFGVVPNGSAFTPTPTPTPTTPALDWRMPATVTTSSGLSGSQSALAGAQAAANSKSRPSITVASAATEWVEYAIAASATPVLLSFVGSPDISTATVTVNGVDAGFVTRFPTGGDVAGTGSTKAGRRQHILLPASGSARTIRLTIAAVANRIIFPLLHQMPSSGPADCHVVMGASREDQGLPSRYVEDAVIAQFATRDPVVFDYAKSSATVDDIDGFATDAASAYGGIASYGIIGSCLANSWTLPYTSGQQSGLTTKQSLIAARLAAAGIKPVVSALTFRTTNSTTPTAQDNGSKPFNDNVVFPETATDAVYAYDTALGRNRWDAYGLSMFWRNLLADDRHGSAAMYDKEVAFLVDQWFRFIYTGSWGTSWSEQIVAMAEAASMTKATALTAYTEATYQMAALASSSSRTALNARLATIYPTALFYDAVRQIDDAVSAATQPLKDAAQAALNAASTAGYSGGTSPNTIAAQQARIDAIVISIFTKEVRIGFGSTTAVTGWNRTAAIANASPVIADLLQPDGSSSGFALNFTAVVTPAAQPNTGLVSSVPEVPTAILAATLSQTSSSHADMTISGLDNAKKYDFVVMASRSGTTAKNIKLTINGTVLADIDGGGNQSNPFRLSNVTPVSGVITLIFARGTGNGSSVYATAIVMKEHT